MIRQYDKYTKNSCYCKKTPIESTCSKKNVESTFDIPRLKTTDMHVDKWCHKYLEKNIAPTCQEVNKTKYYNYNVEKEIIKSSNGGVLEFTIMPGDCEVKGDLVVAEKDTLRIWGEVKDCKNYPQNGVLVTLLRPEYINGKCEYVAECSTYTNSIGYYQFQMDIMGGDTNYKVAVG